MSNGLTEAGTGAAVVKVGVYAAAAAGGAVGCCSCCAGAGAMREGRVGLGG